MKIPAAIVNIALAAILGLEAWTLSTVVALKADVARIEAKLQMLDPARTEISSLNQNQSER